MTRDQIATKVRDNLNDNGITYYSVTDISDSIQDAYDEVAVYCECIEKETTLNFQANTTYYDILDILSDYYRPIHIFSGAQKQFLGFVNSRNLSYYRADWEYVSGSIQEFMLLGPQRLGFSGRLNTVGVSDTFRLFYKATAPILTGVMSALVNDNFILLLENYATADLLEQNQEYTKASIYWQQYDEMLEKYREKIQLLAKGDRMFTRE